MSDLGECDHQDGNPAVWEFVEGGASLFLCVEHILPRIHTLTQQVEELKQELRQGRLHLEASMPGSAHAWMAAAEIRDLNQQVEKAREGLKEIAGEYHFAQMKRIARDTLNAMEGEER